MAAHLKRRTFVRSAAMAAGAVMARPLRAASATDVLVIGAGLSGLRAAVHLEDQGVKLTVIEGKSRAGGRVMSLYGVPGNPEAGANGIGASYGRMIDSAQRFGVALYDIAPRAPLIFNQELALGGKIIAEKDWPNHPRNPFQGRFRSMMPGPLVQRLLLANNPLGKNFGDWTDPKSFHLDVPMHDWLAQQGLDDAAVDLAYNTNCEYGSTAHDVSLLMMAFLYSWSLFQFGQGVNASYAAKGGNQRIPEAMAAGLKSEVQFNKTVAGLRSDATGAEAVCTDGTVYRAKKIVCSIPFAALRTVPVDPVIGGPQGRAIRTIGVQLTSSTHLVAKRPFWKEDGLKPGIWTDGLAGIVMAQPFGDDPGEITSFLCRHRGFLAAKIDRMPVADATRAVVAAIEEIRPSAKGQLEVAGFKSWNVDPFSCGDWVIWQPGQIRAFVQHIGKPHGNIHFCGEHTAVANRGMEGAMESGDRVAQEVLAGI